ncbi:MAG: signal recognition particle protein [Anaerolineae bacterium]
MFESLTEKLQKVFDGLSSRGRLSEADVDTAMREVRLALLEADVNYKVVKDFTARVKERAVGAEVLKSLTPAQQVVKIVNEELVAILGEPAKLDLSGPTPHIIMMVGLQGSGKTTTSAKLALTLRKSGQRPLLVAADTYRPAAIHQLETLGKQLDIPVHSEGDKVAPPQIAANAARRARESAYTVVILDTAGRLQINETLMEELDRIKELTKPQEILLVADSMTGQQAVNVAKAFHERLGLTGLILTKVDGDARGGAAISMREVTGVPIKYLGVGEKTDALEVFHPDRMASRILGMGDMLTLIERAQETMDQEKSRSAAERLMKGEFNLEDFLQQMQQMRKIGPFSQLLDMIPGFNRMSKDIAPDVTDQQLRRIEAIISSMTADERRHPEVINGNRKRRIARGSGSEVSEINDLLSQFKQIKRMMKQFGEAGGGGKRRGRFPTFPGFPMG